MPTDNQIDDILDACEGCGCDECREKVRAIITAAEKAEPTPSPSGWIVRGAEAVRLFYNEDEARNFAGSWGLVKPVYEDRPAPAAQSGAVKVGDLVSIIALWSDDEGLDLSYGQGDNLARRILSALEPAEPATDAEPVAWLMNGKGETWEERNVVTFDKETADMKAVTEWWTVEPLYKGRPPESRLREALEEIANSDYMDNMLDPNRNKRLAEAALEQDRDNG